MALILTRRKNPLGQDRPPEGDNIICVGQSWLGFSENVPIVPSEDEFVVALVTTSATPELRLRSIRGRLYTDHAERSHTQRLTKEEDAARGAEGLIPLH